MALRISVSFDMPRVYTDLCKKGEEDDESPRWPILFSKTQTSGVGIDITFEITSSSKRATTFEVMPRVIYDAENPDDEEEEVHCEILSLRTREGVDLASYTAGSGEVHGRIVIWKPQRPKQDGGRQRARIRLQLVARCLVTDEQCISVPSAAFVWQVKASEGSSRLFSTPTGASRLTGKAVHAYSKVTKAAMAIVTAGGAAALPESPRPEPQPEPREASDSDMDGAPPQRAAQPLRKRREPVAAAAPALLFRSQSQTEEERKRPRMQTHADAMREAGVPTSALTRRISTSMDALALAATAGALDMPITTREQAPVRASIVPGAALFNAQRLGPTPSAVTGPTLPPVLSMNSLPPGISWHGLPVAHESTSTGKGCAGLQRAYTAAFEDAMRDPLGLSTSVADAAFALASISSQFEPPPAPTLARARSSQDESTTSAMLSDPA